jgi:hypothetical protein
MLEVHVDLVPWGVEQGRQRLTTLYVGNDGTGTREVGHYDIYTIDPRGTDKSNGRDQRPGWIGRIEDFERSRGRNALAAEALRIVDRFAAHLDQQPKAA